MSVGKLLSERNMTLYQRALMAALWTSVAAAAIPARAEVVTIPAMAAHPTDGDPSVCIPDPDGFWGPNGGGCYLVFPLTIPVGHMLQQVAIVHSTSTTIPYAPFIQSFVGGTNFSTPPQDIQKFLWTSWDHVPDGTFDRHKLMAEIQIKGGTIYPDSFVVAPATEYYVFVQIENTGLVAIEVTYN